MRVGAPLRLEGGSRRPMPPRHRIILKILFRLDEIQAILAAPSEALPRQTHNARSSDHPRRLARPRRRAQNRGPRLHRRRLCRGGRRRDLRQGLADRRQGHRRGRRLRRGRHRPRGEIGAEGLRERRLARRRPDQEKEGPAALRRAHPRALRRACASRDARRRQADREFSKGRRPVLRQLHPVLRRVRRQAFRRSRPGRRA